ncbi:MAG: LysM peptidoglycan-binding domain-containing protein [Rickettsiales bacterium]|jgi:nucleoid-associated protein YgaU|nr:LysM peptidoglycan-binding domain-containing protein [Rickettsiales bacterium]
MFGKQKRFSDMGKVSNDTTPLIDEAIEKQQEIKRTWSSRRPKTLAVSNPKPSSRAADKPEPIAVLPTKPSSIFNDDSKRGGIGAYWFPLLCIAAVISVALWTFWPKGDPATAKKPSVPEPVVKTVDKPSAVKTDVAAEKQKVADRPVFDIVRVESNGVVVIAGRFKAKEKVSVKINKKIHATVAANSNGEFVYSPKSKLKPGNYVVQLLADKAASDVVFLYIDEKADQSLSLLFTDKSSKVLQSPKTISKGAFAVSKIDYIANKRLVVQGKGLPKLRVSLSMDDKLLGMTRVSDHKNFGLGAGIGELKAGEKHALSVKMHDSRNNIVASIKHEFTMPEMADADETFYVVRRDDCLWVIAKNFYGKGVRFSIIAKENNIKNPNLIYPNQKFKIPVK